MVTPLQSTGLLVMLGLSCATWADNAQWQISTLAGTAGTVINSQDGTGENAQFYFPRGVATDDQGNLYVADSANNTIRKVTAEGTVTTYAGSAGEQGRTDGQGTIARFVDPYGITSDRNNNLYIADTSNNAVRKITPDGNVSTIAGNPHFLEPRGVAVDSAGNVFVADYGNDIVQKVSPNGTATHFAGTLGSPGNQDGTGTQARFRGLMGIAVDQADTIYVADTSNRVIRKITPTGVVTTFAGSGMDGTEDGTGIAASFSEPRALAVDDLGNLYVTDYNAHTLRKITANGTVTTIAGAPRSAGSEDGAGSVARFYAPSGVAVDQERTLFVADTLNNTLRRVDASGTVTTLAGLAGRTSSVDGTGPAARFEDPYALTADSDGNIYVADATDHSIRKITAEGVVTTLAGLPGTFGDADGNGDEARFNTPLGISVDSNGTVYVADTGNETIRKISVDGDVSTLAGSPGSTGARDGTGSFARFSGPYGVAVDTSFNVYVVEARGSTVRKITADGTVSTIAGTSGVNGMTDATGSAASFLVPFDIAVDSLGNLYICDHGNHAIRKVAPDGVVTTLAGNGTPGAQDGTGSEARFKFPSGIAVDATGTVYVADNDNHAIRQITPEGVVTTIAGALGVTGSSDGTGTEARFFNAKDVTVDNSGNLYVADRGNHTIRKGSPITPAESLAPRFLENNETVTLDKDTALFGAAGNETVRITGSATITLDSNIERIELESPLISHTFVISGTQITLSSTNGATVTLSGLNRPITIAFADGSATLVLTGLNQAEFGSVALTTAPSIINAPLNSDDRSAVTTTASAPAN